jgi:hypothetical protein
MWRKARAILARYIMPVGSGKCTGIGYHVLAAFP